MSTYRTILSRLTRKRRDGGAAGSAEKQPDSDNSDDEQCEKSEGDDSHCSEKDREAEVGKQSPDEINDHARGNIKESEKYSMDQRKFIIFSATGGPNLAIQLETGHEGAANPKARAGPFLRNTGFGNSQTEQATASKDDVINVADLSGYGIHTFGDMPMMQIKNGDRYLDGIDKKGEALSVNMSENQSQMCLIYLVPLIMRFLKFFFGKNLTMQKRFIALRRMNSSVCRMDQDAANRKLICYNPEEEDVNIAMTLITEVIMKILCFVTVFSDHWPENDARRNGDGFRLQSRMDVADLCFRLFLQQHPDLDDDEIERLQMAMQLYMEFPFFFSAAVDRMNWEYMRGEAAGADERDLERKAALITVTAPLEELRGPLGDEFSELRGYQKFPERKTFKEVTEEQVFESEPADSQQGKRARRNRQSITRGKQSNEQASHLDAAFLSGVFSSVNPGKHRLRFGFHLYSGRMYRETLKIKKQFKKTFDEEFAHIPSQTQPGKLLHEVMGPKRASLAEKCANAWVLFLDDQLRRISPDLVRQWERKYLPIEPLHGLVSSLRNVHFGPRFPVEFPAPGETLVVPDNLVRFLLHDYHGPSFEWEDGKIVESRDHDTTVDFRQDETLCVGCECMKGSDGLYPRFKQ